MEKLLVQTVRAVALLCDETSELVDKYHRPFQSETGLVAIRERALALSGAAEALRQALPTTPDKADSARSGFQTKVQP
jgi:hypothetical protein